MGSNQHSPRAREREHNYITKKEYVGLRVKSIIGLSLCSCGLYQFMSRCVQDCVSARESIYT